MARLAVGGLLLPVASALLLALLIRFEAGLGFPAALRALLETTVFLNVILAVFNALPIPPLDGSRVTDALVSRRFRPVWESFCRMGPFVLIAVIELFA